jgi:hypothetical protein
MEREPMLHKLSDTSLRILIERGKTLKGAAPFLQPVHGMIALREEGYRRGIVASASDERLVREARLWEGR